MARLFDPLVIGGTEFRNRAWLSPMCQYSCEAKDGVPTDWHLTHLGARAAGGFGLVMTEATAVSPEGRTSPHDVGIWSDEQAAAWARIAEFAKGQGAVVGMQLSHAGRKGSTYRPFDEHQGSVPAELGGWQTVGPDSMPYPGLADPAPLGLAGIRDVLSDFVSAAERANEVGFDVVELHAAHGYLLHEFLSPLTNHRPDEYGGSFGGRVRLLVEVVDAVRKVLVPPKLLFVRVSATDWAAGGWDIEQTCRLSVLLRDRGVDLVDVSSGGAVPTQQIDAKPGFQVPFAAQIRERSGLPVSAVGLIRTAQEAQDVVASGHADAVMLARAALREPSWPLRAAHDLGLSPRMAPYPAQYVRGAWKGS